MKTSLPSPISFAFKLIVGLIFLATSFNSLCYQYHNYLTCTSYYGYYYSTYYYSYYYTTNYTYGEYSSTPSYLDYSSLYDYSYSYYSNYYYYYYYDYYSYSYTYSYYDYYYDTYSTRTVNGPIAGGVGTIFSLIIVLSITYCCLVRCLGIHPRTACMIIFCCKCTSYREIEQRYYPK